MRKEDLMLGDWYRWFGDKEYTAQVVPQTFLLDDMSIGSFEPIRVTTDFFLKNGFKANGNTYTLDKFYGDGAILIKVIDELDGEFSVSMRNYDRFNHAERRVVVEREIINVHQFQHWLRDCDIHLDIIV